MGSEGRKRVEQGQRSWRLDSSDLFQSSDVLNKGRSRFEEWIRSREIRRREPKSERVGAEFRSKEGRRQRERKGRRIDGMIARYYSNALSPSRV